MTNILNRGFSKMTPDALVSKVTLIISRLTGNIYFLITDPTLVQLAAALKGLTDAMSIADPQARDTAVEAAQASLEQTLEDLADNLEKTANNDPVKLATTGYDMRKEPSPTGGALSLPQNLRLKLTGNIGEAQVLFDAVDRAKGYQLQTCADPNAGPWLDYDTFSSTRGIVLKGFPRAKDVWVRVRAIGPNNTKSAWSDPATILIN